ncbi:MAG TPA: hypothetical protein VH020_10305 [Stellaceae bacterium]|jgi:hypothetical protein|nr:hypothetical protein [Stellaceae bacterium]
MNEAEPMRNDDVAVERRDVPPWLAAALAAGMAVFLVLTAIAVSLVYPRSMRGPSDAPRTVTAQPRLQIDPVHDLVVFRAAEERALDSYGWIDKERGVVRIPIAQAMQDVAAQGIKDWPEAAR